MRGVVPALLLGCMLLGIPQPAEAGLVTGPLRIVGGIVRLPLSIIAGTLSGPPIVGTALGAVNGAFQSVGMVAAGTLETAVGVARLGRMAAPFLLPFLF